MYYHMSDDIAKKQSIKKKPASGADIIWSNF